MRTLVSAGADPDALENDAYDMVTIAAVANGLKTLKLALALGCKPGNITSRYDGMALIAAAHLGHSEVVQVLIDAGPDLNIPDRDGNTPLGLAIKYGYEEMAELLESAGARLTNVGR